MNRNSLSNSCNLLPRGKAATPKNQESKLAYLDLYPNPVKARLRLSTSQPGKSAIIRSAIGKMVTMYHIKKEVTVLPVSELPPGVYLLQYGQESRKFVIAH